MTICRRFVLRAMTAVLLLKAASVAAEEPVRNGYDGVRIKAFPVAVQCWSFRNFTFMETLDRVHDLGIKYLQPYRGQKLSAATGDAVFGPSMTDEHIALVRDKLGETGISLVSYGVVNFDNTEAAAREVFDFAKKMGIRTIVTEPSYDDYSVIEKLVKEYNIRIAIHNHPAPSKYARPETVIARVKGRDPRIGACADTGHWMRTSVVPVDALVALGGRITDVHLKDLNAFGDPDAVDVPFGQGKANIHDILAELTIQDYDGYLSIEHENPADVDNPSPAIRAGVEYLESIMYYKGYERLLAPINGVFSKHGWNHYGPGYFSLDSATGVLTSEGGMGLLWYAAKKYRNFALELDYRCMTETTNSGVFIRVPELVSSNAYIYHSFEIQIDDTQTGIHATGSVYDAEAPKKTAAKPTGQWNHYKISFVGDRITIELNSVPVNDWRAVPRGKIRDFATEGYIGLQNHDSSGIVQFKNIYIKELP